MVEVNYRLAERTPPEPRPVVCGVMRPTDSCAPTERMPPSFRVFSESVGAFSNSYPFFTSPGAPVVVFSIELPGEKLAAHRISSVARHSEGKRLHSRAGKLLCSRSHDYIVQNKRVASVQAARRKLVKLIKKPKSNFYWYDLTVRGRRYRASSKETKPVKALKVASLKLASVIENTDPLPTKSTALGDFAERFLAWVDTARLEAMTRKFYRNGWRLLKATHVVEVRVNQITGDCAEQLKFPASAANANCALRTLRRMLHKAEEWRMIGHAPKIKMLKEHGRHLRLDDEAEKKLLAGALACKWRQRTHELFRDIVILMRDTGMRNQRELYRMRIENLDWESRVIFVPDSKTAEGRRLVPMSGRVFEILRDRCRARQEGWVFPSKRSASGDR